MKMFLIVTFHFKNRFKEMLSVWDWIVKSMKQEQGENMMSRIGLLCMGYRPHNHTCGINCVGETSRSLKTCIIKFKSAIKQEISIPTLLRFPFYIESQIHKNWIWSKFSGGSWQKVFGGAGKVELFVSKTLASEVLNLDNWNTCHPCIPRFFAIVHNYIFV